MTADPVRLTRHRQDRIVGGVCAGLARDTGTDVTLVRVVAIVLGFLGVGVVLYAALMLVVPEEGQDAPLLKRAIDGDDRPLVAGLLLVCTIGVASFDGPFGWLEGDGWPVVLVLAGASALAVGFARRDAGPVAAGASHPDATGVVDGPADGTAGGVDEGDGPPSDAAPTTPRPAASTSAPGRHAGTAGATAVGVALLAFALAGGLIFVFGLSIGWDVVLAGAVVLVGLVLLAAAPFGGARALVPLGLALAAVAGVAAAADLELDGGVGERTFRPTALVELDERYELSAGRLELDLRALPLSPGGNPVRAQVGFGELIVRVPEHAPVRVRARAAGGDLNVLGKDKNGLDVVAEVEGPGRGPATSARLDVDAQVGFGEITVVRGDERVDDARRDARVAGAGGR